MKRLDAESDEDFKLRRNARLREVGAIHRARIAAGEIPEARRMLNPIEKAKAAPKSLTKALRAYHWDMSLVLANQGTPDGKTLRQDAEAAYRKNRALSREVGLPAVIKGICWVCVAADEDPGGGERIKNCACPSCPLHPVRPKKAGQPPQHLRSPIKPPLETGTA